MLKDSLSRVLLFFLLLLFFACGSKKNQTYSLYEVKKADFINEVTVSGFLESANSVKIVCPRLRTDITIQYLIPEGSYVNRGDTVCILDAPEILSRYKEAVKNFEISSTEYNKINQNLKLQFLLLEAQVRTIEATTRISELDSLQSEYVSEPERRIIGLEIQKSKLEKQKLKDKLRFLKQINDSELRKLKLKIKQAQNDVDRNQERLNKLVLTTSVDGVVEYAINRATRKKVVEGDVIWNNRPILNIPDLTKMQAKIIASESAYKRIAQGQKVIISVDAFPKTMLQGKIKRKSPVGRSLSKNNDLKVFDVIASIDSIGKDINPGLSLTCTVIAEIVPDTIIIPLTALFEEDSISFVYLKKNRDFIKKEVELGSQSLTYTIISKGLVENDRISIIKPW